jgi:hypothetical protein
MVAQARYQHHSPIDQPDRRHKDKATHIHPIHQTQITTDDTTLSNNVLK